MDGRVTHTLTSSRACCRFASRAGRTLGVSSADDTCSESGSTPCSTDWMMACSSAWLDTAEDMEVSGRPTWSLGCRSGSVAERAPAWRSEYRQHNIRVYEYSTVITVRVQSRPLVQRRHELRNARRPAPGARGRRFGDSDRKRRRRR